MSASESLHLHAERIIKPPYRNIGSDYLHMQFLTAQETPIGWTIQTARPNLLDEQNKYSEGYVSCTGIVITGDSIANNKPISTLTHHVPGVVMDPRFEGIIETMAKDVKNKAIRETVEVGIVGGAISLSHETDTDINVPGIIKITEILVRLIREHIGVNPVFLAGPIIAQSGTPTNVYLHTAQKKLHIAALHHKEGSFIPGSFPANELTSRIKEFQSRLT